MVTTVTIFSKWRSIAIQNDIDKENVSVCRLLHFLNIDDIVQHVEFLARLNLEVDSYALDGAYDSFNNYADIWNHLYINITIFLPSDAVISVEGGIEQINHRINKM
jgi:hypothetical protein